MRHFKVWKDKRQVTEEEIEENLQRVEEEKPLTLPLAVLDGRFKKEYDLEQKRILEENGMVRIFSQNNPEEFSECGNIYKSHSEMFVAMAEVFRRITPETKPPRK